MKSNSIFLVTQIGCEALAKSEAARALPGSRPGFATKGFVTLKLDKMGKRMAQADFDLPGIFVRAFGLCFGSFSLESLSPDAVVEQIEALAGKEWSLREGVSAATSTPKRHIHLWQTDAAQGRPRDPEDKQRDLVAAFRESQPWLRGWSSTTNSTAKESAPRNGDLVLDLILTAPDRLWVGLHQHHQGHSPAPGGERQFPLLEEAPSRAYLKFEEALALTGWQWKKQENVLEIGSAPGGTLYDLLKRGHEVLAIDPRPLDPVLDLWMGKRLYQLQESVFDIPPSEMPTQVDWVLLDMNLKPPLAVAALRKVCLNLRKPPKGAILTLKLSHELAAQHLEECVRLLEDIGAKDVKMKQLFHSGREVACWMRF